jgi:hypothetical protein
MDARELPLPGVLRGRREFRHLVQRRKLWKRGREVAICREATNDWKGWASPTVDLFATLRKLPGFAPSSAHVILGRGGESTQNEVRGMTWSCPKCGRSFTRKNQRHACGTGDGTDVLRGRPETLVAVYRTVESFAKSLGKIEIVSRDRYVLLRTVRIFADLVIMTDAVRIAIHLPRTVSNPVFFKVAADTRHVSHVAKLRRVEDVDVVKPYIEEAYNFSLAAPS